MTLGDQDKTEAVHMHVLGKHSRGGKREEAYGMFGAVSASLGMTTVFWSVAIGLGAGGYLTRRR